MPLLYNGCIGNIYIDDINLSISFTVSFSGNYGYRIIEWYALIYTRKIGFQRGSVNF